MQVLVNTSNNTELHNHHGHNPDDDFDIYLPAKNVVAEQLYELDKMPRTIDDAVDLKRTNGPQGGRFVRSYYLKRVNSINIQQALMGVEQLDDMPQNGNLATLR